MTAQAIAEVSSVCISLRRDFCCKNSGLLLWWSHPRPEPSCLEGIQNGNALGKAIFGWGSCSLCKAQPCHLSHQKRSTQGGLAQLAVTGSWRSVCIPVLSLSPNVIWNTEHEKNCCVCTSSPVMWVSTCPPKDWGVLLPQALSQVLPCVVAAQSVLLWLCGGTSYCKVSSPLPVRVTLPYCVSGEHPAVRWQLDIQGYKHEPLQTSRKQSYEITSCFLVAITQLVFRVLGWIPAGGMWHPAGALSPVQQ